MKAQSQQAGMQKEEQLIYYQDILEQQQTKSF
jgi:hypothetical protein